MDINSWVRANKILVLTSSNNKDLEISVYYRTMDDVFKMECDITLQQLGHGHIESNMFDGENYRYKRHFHPRICKGSILWENFPTK